ncbi:MAG: pyridoxamine 5'-phosphate oxidase family protein [Anaerolineae bacterium]|nr:pyridoxamine 5'-phosphate oxidase family protein [Anaerolineae bacterium]
MAKLTAELLDVLGALRIFPVATATPDGKPNLVFVAFLRVIDDETLEIADNRFHKTRQNLEANPTMSVTFWSPEKTGCYQVKGRAELITQGPIYDECVAWVHQRSDRLTPKAAVRLHVEEIYSGAERIA